LSWAGAPLVSLSLAWVILSELFGRILSAIFGILVPIVVRPITGLSGAASTNFFLTRSVDLENFPPPPN
jgi:hypothetical protein